MSYQEKCIENENVGKITYENGYYNASVNRYYYSFFQFLMDRMNCFKIKIDSEEVANGSHVKAFKSYKNYLQNNNKVKRGRINQLNSNFFKLRNLRAKADYDEEKIEKKEADLAISTYNMLKREINSIK